MILETTRVTDTKQQKLMTLCRRCSVLSQQALEMRG